MAQRAGLRMSQHIQAPEKCLDGDVGKHSSLYLSQSQFPTQLPKIYLVCLLADPLLSYWILTHSGQISACVLITESPTSQTAKVASRLLLLCHCVGTASREPRRRLACLGVPHSLASFLLHTQMELWTFACQ